MVSLVHSIMNSLPRMRLVHSFGVGYASVTRALGLAAVASAFLGGDGYATRNDAAYWLTRLRMLGQFCIGNFLKNFELGWEFGFRLWNGLINISRHIRSLACTELLIHNVASKLAHRVVSEPMVALYFKA